MSQEWVGWIEWHNLKKKLEKIKKKQVLDFILPSINGCRYLVIWCKLCPSGRRPKQHLELCRDIAQKFNNEFKVEEFLKIPEPLIKKEFSRIMSLKDGTKKWVNLNYLILVELI